MYKKQYMWQINLFITTCISNSVDNLTANKSTQKGYCDTTNKDETTSNL